MDKSLFCGGYNLEFFGVKKEDENGKIVIIIKAMY